MVTNGGWGGVLSAVEAGVPLVVAGADLDPRSPAGSPGAAWGSTCAPAAHGRPPSGPRCGGSSPRPACGAAAGRLGERMVAAGGAASAADAVERVLAGR